MKPVHIGFDYVRLVCLYVWKVMLTCSFTKNVDIYGHMHSIIYLFGFLVLKKNEQIYFLGCHA